jgi:hypothetical protein
MKNRFCWCVGVSGKGRVNGECKEGGIRSVYFIYVCENRMMKLVEVILSRGEMGEGK